VTTESRGGGGPGVAGPLPLPLVAFERYMLADDRPDHPMTFTLRLTLSGELDRRAFAAAVAIAVGRHPLLAAHVQRRGRRGLQWVAAPDPRPWIDCGAMSEPRRFPGSERIDLGSATGLRLWVRTSPARTEISAQFHHACCDGVGAYRFLEDLLVAYDRAARPEGVGATFRPLDPGLLRRRARFGLSWPRALLRLLGELWGVAIGLPAFFLIRPAALASPCPPVLDEASRQTVLDCPSHTFDRAESEDLLRAARADRATLTDVLLRDLLTVVHVWNARHDPALRRRGLRIAIPMNLRGAGDEALPAANVVGLVFIDHRPHRFRDPRWLLTVIKIETRFAKTLRVAQSFVRCVAALGAIPGALRLLARSGRCHATATLSNVGEVFADAPLPRRGGRLAAGGLVLEEVRASAPVRPFTSVALAPLSYAGRLTLTMSYDRHRLTAEAADQLLEWIVAQLRRTAARASAAPRAAPAIAR
jgi:hypothetical protein